MARCCAIPPGTLIPRNPICAARRWIVREHILRTLDDDVVIVRCVARNTEQDVERRASGESFSQIVACVGENRGRSLSDLVLRIVLLEPNQSICRQQNEQAPNDLPPVPRHASHRRSNTSHRLQALVVRERMCSRMGEPRIERHAVCVAVTGDWLGAWVKCPGNS